MTTIWAPLRRVVSRTRSGHGDPRVSWSWAAAVGRPPDSLYLTPETVTDGRRRFSQYLRNVLPLVSGSPEHQNGAIPIAEFSDDPREFQTRVHLGDPTLA